MSAADTPREQDVRFSQAERDHIATLYRRLDWLAKRSGLETTSKSMQDWIRREMAALNWALKKIKGEV